MPYFIELHNEGIGDELPEQEEQPLHILCANAVCPSKK